MRRERGLTLVELSVALFVGTLLALAIIEIFFSALTLYGEQMERAREQQNLRFASFFPTYIARQSAYRIPAESLPADQFPDGAVQGFDNVPNAGGALVINSAHHSATIGDALPGTDIVGFAYRSRDDLSQNCHGTKIPPNDYVLDVFYISLKGELKCHSRYGSPATIDPQPLVDGVAGLHVLYGEDVTQDNSVNRYVPLSAGDDFSNVLAVRLLICAVDKIADAAAQNTECGDPLVDPENWLTQTVSLRNWFKLDE